MSRFMQCLMVITVAALVAAGCSTEEEKKQAHYARALGYLEKGE